jgi:hypothetical protein
MTTTKIKKRLSTPHANPRQEQEPSAWIPFFHAFLLISKSQIVAILIDFVAPAVFLVLQNFQGIMERRSLSSQQLPSAVTGLVAYTLLTSAVNLIVFQFISLRESGELRNMAHTAGSVRPVAIALIISQTLIATAEATILALLGMLVARHWSLPVLLAVILASPIAMLLLSGFFLPTLRLRLTPGGLTAIVSLLILIFLSLPSGLNGVGHIFIFTEDLNPYQLVTSLILLLTRLFGGPTLAVNMSDTLISLGIGTVLCLILGIVGLSRPLLTPIERRR